MTMAAQLSRTAAASMHAGRYAQAEVQARQALSIDHDAGVANEVLAAALDAQGKEQEALQSYQDVVTHYDSQPRVLLPYALLLLKSGHWEQAATAYNKAMSQFDERDLLRKNSHFSPTVPDPAGLTVAIHLARGLTYGSCNWAGEAQDEEGMNEDQKARDLAPDSAVTNYYCGYGWKRLDPKSPLKSATAVTAKVALQRAALSTDDEVNKAATEALEGIK